jgi:hypothetical protein
LQISSSLFESGGGVWSLEALFHHTNIFFVLFRNRILVESVVGLVSFICVPSTDLILRKFKRLNVMAVFLVSCQQSLHSELILIRLAVHTRHMTIAESFIGSWYIVLARLLLIVSKRARRCAFYGKGVILISFLGLSAVTLPLLVIHNASYFGIETRRDQPE